MHENTVAGANVAVGYLSLYHNTTGESNVGVGAGAMQASMTANASTAVGTNALQANTTSGSNTAIGSGAMTFSTGPYNTAVGTDTMSFNVGKRNVAVGYGALNMGGAGSNNTALGYFAGETLTGSNNVVIGYNAGVNLTATSNSNNIEIGTLGNSRDANVIRLGDPAVQKKTFIAGVNHSTIGNGVAVMVNNQGELGVATSSARYKRDIKPMDKASEAILSLQPVTFRYKQELDSSGTPQFGLVAEQVAKVDPDLVARDENGKPYTVRYEAVDAMLLNEFLEEHGKVETLEKRLSEQDKINARLESALQAQATQTAAIDELRAALKAQSEQLHRVSAAVQRKSDAPRLVSNKRFASIISLVPRETLGRSSASQTSTFPCATWERGVTLPTSVSGARNSGRNPSSGRRWREPNELIASAARISPPNSKTQPTLSLLEPRLQSR